MRADAAKWVFFCGLISLLVGLSVVSGIRATDREVTVTSHPATQSEIDELKSRLGVRDPNRNYNEIIDGHGTGLALPTEEEYAQMVGSLRIVDQASSPEPLAASFDLSTDSCFPAVGNQGAQGSCAAWAATYYASGYVIGKNYNWTLAHIGYIDQLLSPAWTYNKCNGGADYGSWMDANMYVTQTVGCSRMRQMMYNMRDPVSWGTEAAWRDAPPYRANNIYSLPLSISTLKTIVALGNPVTFAFDASSYGNFGSDDVLGSGAMLPNVNHANTIVGYDDSKRDAETGEVGAFKIVNSWGYSWGPDNNGYYWMTYQAFLGSWNPRALNYIDCRYVNNHPQLIGVWRLDPQPDRSASVKLGIGPHSSPLATRVPRWNGSSNVMHQFPGFMCLDITEFFGMWMSQANDFYLDIGDATNDGTITSFKVEYYEDGYVPGNPTIISSESPDTPRNTPGYVALSFTNPSSTLIDDADQSFVIYQGIPWRTLSYPDAYAGSAHYIGKGTGGNTVGWRVDSLVTPGTYGVYTWKFSNPYSSWLAKDAHFVVKDRNGLSSWIVVDQSTLLDEWVYLGNFQFDHSSMQGVGVSDYFTMGRYVLADAVMLVHIADGMVSTPRPSSTARAIDSGSP